MANTKKNTKTQTKVVPQSKEITEMQDDVLSQMKEMQKLIEKQAKVIQDLEKKMSKNGIEDSSSNSSGLDSEYEVEVINLYNGELSLSTEGFGNGVVYTFNGRGYTRDIPYNDLKELIHANRSFVESGRIYINDEQVVKKFKLEKYYKTMLKADDFDKLKTMKYEELERTLENLPRAERTTLNSGNEPTQFDLAYAQIVEDLKNGVFPESLYSAVENVYYKVYGKRINIREEMDFYSNDVMGAK